MVKPAKLRAGILAVGRRPGQPNANARRGGRRQQLAQPVAVLHPLLGLGMLDLGRMQKRPAPARLLEEEDVGHSQLGQVGNDHPHGKRIAVALLPDPWRPPRRHPHADLRPLPRRCGRVRPTSDNQRRQNREKVMAGSL